MPAQAPMLTGMRTDMRAAGRSGRSAPASARTRAAKSPREGRRRFALVTLALGLGALGAITFFEQSRATALESGPLFAQEMRQANGLMVVVSPQPVLPTFTATIHYQIGSAHEWQGLYGATELLAQLLFDSQPGTRDPAQELNVLGQLDQVDVGLRRRRLDLQVSPAASAPQIMSDVSMLQGQLNSLQESLASTSFFRIAELLYLERGSIGPTVTVTPTEVQVTVTLPSDQLSFFMALERMRMLSFSSRGFYAAREKLANQRSLEDKEPSTRLFRGLLASAYHLHPFGHMQADAGSIQSISRDELEQFYRLELRPSLTVISLAGGVRADEVRNLAAQYWGDIPRGREPDPLPQVEPNQSGLRKTEIIADAPTEVMMAFPRSAAGASPAGPLLPLLTELLADPEAGLLTPLTVQGLAESVVALQYPPASPLSSLYPDVLMVGAKAAQGASAERLEAAIRGILDTLATDGPSPMALEGARARLKARMARSMTEPTLAAPMLARAYATFGEVEVLNRFYTRLDSVSASDVRMLARTLFAESNTNLALLHAEAKAEAGHAEDGKAEAGGESASQSEGGH